MDFPGPGMARNKYLMLISLPAYGILLQQPEWTNTEENLFYDLEVARAT
jgi:hypothetical protein